MRFGLDWILMSTILKMESIFCLLGKNFKMSKLQSFALLGLITVVIYSWNIEILHSCFALVQNSNVSLVLSHYRMLHSRCKTQYRFLSPSVTIQDHTIEKSRRNANCAVMIYQNIARCKFCVIQFKEGRNG